ncbi:DUF4145 domain-containing protein [Shewanella sp. YLB-07]|uniref:DUF4145 domain-containing protein n=1 Tax=Shewanella sp. YLB-07 TaxID=2601268 RepID=UPI00128B0A67|nr:DUF4145 domain-containing protein [Shewanella sp. YLB-07]MPY24530.1 DUF4145 domain-containing protein [Shewanella sp. YLB-07]
MKEFSNRAFNVKHVPQWECPTCQKGLLEVSGSLKLEEQADTLHSHDHPEYSHEWVSFTVQGALKCNNRRCLEHVMMVGNGSVDLEQYYDERGQTQGEYHTYCEPKYFQPHLKIFNIPEYVPQNIAAMLDKSFALFFCDSDSCGNRIRACVEVLLEEVGIPKLNEKQKFVSLDSRIKQLAEKDDEVKVLLLAIKWLGNIGTHGADDLSRKDTLDAYKIMQRVFEFLFKPEDDHSEIHELAVRIVKARGPVSHKVIVT